ncbi:hypothetical protein BDF22DRAFT_695083 [Syncephalis plumigaleata]|nr:hypothetical protein BDF22DRAFT_695083 [Syncephalis plumigaleata]
MCAAPMSRESSGARTPYGTCSLNSPISPTLSASSGQSPPLRAQSEHRRFPSQSSVMSTSPMDAFAGASNTPGLVKVMQTLENQAAAVRQSQDMAHIQAELRRFSESAKSPNLADAAQKLVRARGKLESVNNLLLRVQERLDRLLTQITRHIELGSS